MQNACSTGEEILGRARCLHFVLEEEIALCNHLQMFDTPSHPPDVPATDETSDLLVVLAERRLRLLQELTEIGMKLARELGSGETPEAPTNDKAPAKVSDPAAAFAPLSRAIRLTLALEARTGEEIRDLKAGVVRMREARRVVDAEEARKAHAAREWQVPAQVMSVIEAQCESPEEIEILATAMNERLEEDEAYLFYQYRPLRETVERLCKDLGLNPDWDSWGADGWIDEDLPSRSRFSPFNTPSSTPILNADGSLKTPPTPTPLSAVHDLE
jgi:hypothetical protein